MTTFDSLLSTDVMLKMKLQTAKLESKWRFKLLGLLCSKRATLKK